MLREFAQFLIEATEAKEHVIDGRDYTSRALAPVKPPMPAPIVFATLTGLIDYIKTLKDDGEVKAHDGVLIHVVNANLVTMIDEHTDEWEQRDEHARATTDQHADDFAFGTYMDQEQFVIGLRSLFVGTPDREKLLAVAGNLSAQSTVSVEDDGVSQSVGLKTGVMLKSRETLPALIKLKPWRTFREADQPESEFIVRVKQEREGSVPKIALFEADGGAWKLQAVKNVAAVLVKELPQGWRVLA